MSFKDNELLIQFFLTEKEYLFDIAKSESKEDLANEIEFILTESYKDLNRLENTDSTIKINLIAYVFRSMSIDVDQIAEEVWKRVNN